MMSWEGSNDKEEEGWRKGPWTPDEDKKLIEHIKLHGDGRWTSVSKISGLNRNGKSCRLRWINYLRPGLKRGNITPPEEGIIIELHALWGNKWSTIARYLPGRTDNEIKNYWRTHFKKKRKPSHKQEKQRRSTSQLQKEKDELGANNKIDNQNMYELEFKTLEPESRKDDLFRYPSMDFQYYLPQKTLYQNEMSSIAVDDLWGGLWILEDDHPS